MPKQKNSESLYVTKEILKKEFSKSEKRFDAKIGAVEKRLDAKIDASTQSMKDYTDNRFTQLDTKIDAVEKRLDAKIESKIDASTQAMKDYTDSRTAQVQASIKKLGEKLDTAVKGIVQMLERSFGSQAKVDEHLEDHEQRIKKLEEQSV